MKNTRCPLCHDDSKIIIHRKTNAENLPFDVVRCTRCNHVYTFFDKEINDHSLYADEVYKVVENRESIYNKVISFESHRILKYLDGVFPSQGRLLDFGCGKGHFLFSARKKGWNVKGIETSRPRAGYAKDVYKLDVLTDVYERGQIGDSKMDVITFFHVVEHLPSPEELVSNITKENLSEHSLMIMEVPNYGSLQSKIAGHRWLHLDIPRHLSHFTRERIGDLVRQLNYDIVRVQNFSIHLGVLGMAQALMSWVGYHGNILHELKNNLNHVKLKIVFVLPLAILIEFIASQLSSGGIIRLYCRRKK